MSARITCLGVGNPIMGDDATGLELLRIVEKQGPRGVTYTDGGTSGMEILPDILDADYLLLLDALAGPGTSGDVVTLEGDQIPRLLQSKLSPHQVGLLDLLSAARLLDQEPAAVAVVGVVAQDVQLHVGITDTVAEALPAAADSAVALLNRWCQRQPS
ncbi:Hydrogenase 2 maturation protease [Corynebacterium atrinae]|uniref:hydrogenase maturation protease n=1 Tax=Corynebacterium atrinae TaxID=1336740 RepID=UPI0025B5091B|nr:hydrogenase maturation protease [Corynebacterium atrinae]WJY62669.1 Hydrogenase 2 maturation protease [Corynebacterium atrinae]